MNKATVVVLFAVLFASSARVWSQAATGWHDDRTRARSARHAGWAGPGPPSPDPACRASGPSRGRAGGTLPSGMAGPSCGATRAATVVRIIDGDTVILRMGGQRARVRLIGVDAPETWLRHDCFGVEATRALRGMLPSGSAVRAAGDAEPRDRYGRLLLYLWSVPDGRPQTSRGRFVNAELLRAGLARAMTVPPNTGYASVLHEAERTARRVHAGLWHACARLSAHHTAAHRIPPHRTATGGRWQATA